jgi:hypothetical protein
MTTSAAKVTGCAAALGKAQNEGDIFGLELAIAHDGGFSVTDAATVIERSAVADCPWEEPKVNQRRQRGWRVRRGGRRGASPGTVTLNRRVADLVLMRVKTRSTSEKGPMPSFDIDVTRDGGWWAVHIPELGGLTQARYPSEVEPMAREYIAVSTGTSVDQVAINWRRCTLQPR